jgi:hypothetical protein
MDWISQYVNGVEIDFESLGSRWLLFNQLTYDCSVPGMQRLGPSGDLQIGVHGIRYTFSLFTPTVLENFHVDRFDETLNRYIHPMLDNNLRISLGLSGGLDSRVLLACLLSSNKKFTTHTFGAVSDPDVSISESISRLEGFSHVMYDSPIPDTSKVIALLSDYVSQTNLIEPISTVLRLRHYEGLDSSTHLLMDGGFGEVARRQYLNRLAFTGKKAFENRSVDFIYGHLRTNRGEIFNADVKQEMLSGVHREIGWMLDTMPELSTVGFENYLDLWAVRTRIPNYSSDEQGRLDSTIFNYMPLANPGFIDEIFNMPVKYRKNGKLFRSVIKRLRPSLATYPLVKNNTTYPFSLPTVGSWLWSKTKIKLGYQYHDVSTHLFLESVKEYLMDLLHSRDTIEYAAYDHSRIEKIISGYYHGDRTLSSEVNWWLSFELWRRNIEPTRR